MNYVKEHLTVSNELRDSDAMNDLLCIFIIELNTAIVTMYRPPDSTVESFRWSIKKVNIWLSKILQKSDGVRVIVNGDFNLGKLGDWEDKEIEKTKDKINEKIYNKETIGSEKAQMLELIEFAEKWGLMQNIKDITREDRILDLVFTNEDIVCDTKYERHAKISDHDTIILKVDLDTPIEDKTKKENFCSTDILLYKTDQMSSEQIEKAKEFLDAQNWDDIDADKLTDIIERMVKENCDLRNPVKTTKEGNSYKSKNRIPRQVRLWLRRKSLASKALRKVKTIKGCRRLKEKIEEAELELSKSMFKRKIEEENNAINKMKTNPKHFYTYIKKKTKSKNKIGPFVNEKGEVIKEHPAESLQTQYKSAWSVPSDTFRVKNKDRFFESKEDGNPKLEYVSVTRNKIRKAIGNLKNGAAPGPDGVPVEILKTFCDQLLEPLEIIYSNSIENSVFPAAWKPAHVIPVKKPGKSKAKAESFRPVSLTSHMGKVLEAIVRKELQDFLEDNNLLTDGQHGFRKGRSCISQILVHCDLIMSALEDDNNMDVIYLDYKKAFDKADHGVIIHRLKEKGITGKLGQWIQSFLEERSQVVLANNKMSRREQIISGVPQGSVLGPLLFLILIDSLAESGSGSGSRCGSGSKPDIGIFADDTRIARKIAEETDAMNLQSDLEDLYDWAKANNMEFNGSKFQSLKYGRNMELKELYNYENSDCSEAIGDVDCTRDLGIEMATDGTFNNHIAKIVKKVRRKMGWVSRSFFRNTAVFKRMLWRTYIQSIIDYGSQVWAPIDPVQIAKLEGLLKSYSQGVYGLDKLNYWSRLKEMRLSSIHRRMERYWIIYIWKAINGLVPNFGLKWDINERRGLMIHIRKYKSDTPAVAINMIEQSLAVNGGKLFNMMPDSIRGYVGSIDGFKILLDEYLCKIPDQPLCAELYPEPICKETCKNSNSLLDWVPFLRIRERRKCKNPIQLE